MMRDLPLHHAPILAGLWGGRNYLNFSRALEVYHHFIVRLVVIVKRLLGAEGIVGSGCELVEVLWSARPQDKCLASGLKSSSQSPSIIDLYVVYVQVLLVLHPLPVLILLVKFSSSIGETRINHPWQLQLQTKVTGTDFAMANSEGGLHLCWFRPVQGSLQEGAQSKPLPYCM